MTRLRTFLISTFVLVGCQLVSAQIPCSYTVTHTIQGPWCGEFWGYPPTYASGISPNGRYVVGYYEICGNGFYRSFLFDTLINVMTTLPWPGSGWHSMTAADCNNAGVVVGDGWSDSVAGGRRGWIYDSVTQQYTIIEPLGGSWSLVAAINSTGAVCGYRSNTYVGDPANPHEAFIWTPNNGGEFTNLGVLNGPKSAATDIADDGTVVGWTGGNGLYNVRAFTYSKGSISVLPAIMPGGSSQASATNGNLVVGFGRTAWNVFEKHAFVFDIATKIMVTIPPPVECESICEDVSPDGLVVGAFLCNPFGHPLVWSNGRLANIGERTINPNSGVIVGLTSVSANDVTTAAGLDAAGKTVAFVLELGFASPADIAPNCRVDIDDLLLVVNEWSESDSPADINQDNTVNVEDLLMVINEWTIE
jgi:uncharacterized membrane protein